MGEYLFQYQNLETSQIFSILKKIMKTNSANFQKWKTYLLTFTAYVTLHTMRMSYSQSKPNFQRSYQLSNLFLGLFDALVYLSLGTGFFLRFLLEGRKHLTLSFLTFISIACLAYSIIPITSLILKTEVTDNIFFQEILPGICLLVFGFCQFPAWPTLLTLTNQHFDLKSQGRALGIWSANGDLGNIVGFGLSGFLIDTLQFSWEVAMLTAACLNFSMAVVIFFFVREKKQTANPEMTQQLLKSKSVDEEQEKEKALKFKRFIGFVKEITKSTENKLYLLSMGLLKSILYGFLLWMPTYLAHNDLNSYKATIPIAFNAGTLLGSFILGHLYEDLKMGSSQKVNKIKRHIKNFALFYSCIGVVATLTIFYLISVQIAVYFILSAISGAFLGGCFNMLASNEVIAITGGKKDEVNFLSTLSMVIGNWMVGLVEIVIGIVFDMKNDPQGEKKLFLILLGVGAVAISILFVRSKIRASSTNQNSKEQPPTASSQPLQQQ